MEENMICDIEVDRILTKTHGLIEERSAGGITTHVFLGVVADFNAKVFPLELRYSVVIVLIAEIMGPQQKPGCK